MKFITHLLILGSISTIWGQGSGGASKIVSPIRGLVPYGSYSLSDTESIDEASGALQLRIPLAALPAGRAGHSASIEMTYSSRIFDTFYAPAPGGNGTYETFGTQRSTDGGWRYAYGVEIRLEQRSAVDTSNCLSNDEIRRKFKLVAIFPDGSKHEFRYSQVTNENQNDQANSLADGWYDFRPDGFRENACTGGKTAISAATQFTWFTIDGTYARLTFDRDADGANWENNRWTLSMADGSKITGGNENQKLWDRNGNFVEIQNVMEGSFPTTKLVQTISGTTPLIRDIKIERNTTSLVDKIYFRAPGGTLIFHTIEKRLVQAASKQYSCSDTRPDLTCYLSSSAAITVGTPDPNKPDLFQYAYEVTRVVLANNQSYLFEYNSTANAGGWGELSKMTLPTGGVVNYKYKLDQSPDGASRPAWRQTLLNSIKEKKVQYARKLPDGSEVPVEEITTFDFLRSTPIGIEWSENIITGPDGGVTKHYLQSPSFEPRLSKQAGLLRKTIRPDGSEIDRIWTENFPDGVTAAISDQGLFMVNAYASAELTTRPFGSTIKFSLAKRGRLAGVQGDAEPVSVDENVR